MMSPVAKNAPLMLIFPEMETRDMKYIAAIVVVASIVVHPIFGVVTGLAIVTAIMAEKKDP